VVDRLIGIDPPHDGARRRGDGLRIAEGADGEQHSGAVLLLHRNVERRLRLAQEPVVENVSRDSHDGEPGLVVGAGTKAPSDGVLAGPVAVGELLADDRDRGGVLPVAGAEGPPGRPRNAEGLEVAIGDDTVMGDGTLGEVLDGPPLDVDGARVVVPARREHVRRVGGDDARDPANAFDHRPENCRRASSSLYWRSGREISKVMRFSGSNP
jgi:hypothetical protein